MISLNGISQNFRLNFFFGLCFDEFHFKPYSIEYLTAHKCCCQCLIFIIPNTLKNHFVFFCQSSFVFSVVFLLLCIRPFFPLLTRLFSVFLAKLVLFLFKPINILSHLRESAKALYLRAQKVQFQEIKQASGMIIGRSMQRSFMA